MALTAQELQRLHRVHQQITELQEKQDAGPRRLKITQNRLSATDQRQLDLKEKQTRTRMEIDEKNLTVQEHEARIADLQTKLNTCTTNKEYQSLVEDIGKQKQSASDMEDLILLSLEDLSQQDQGLQDLAGELKQLTAEGNTIRQEVEAETAKLNQRMDVARVELADAEKALPVDFLQDYQRMADARGEGALAAVDNDCCGGCYQRITHQMINELHLSKPVCCNSCGCLLYLPESDPVSDTEGS